MKSQLPSTLAFLRCYVNASNKITDPSSRQRGRYNITNSSCLEENLKEIEKLVAGPRWAPDTKTDGRLIVGRNVTLTLTCCNCLHRIAKGCWLPWI
jgi:hypothetical protein